MIFSSPNKNFLQQKKFHIKSQKKIRLNTLDAQCQTNTFKKNPSSANFNYKRNINIPNFIQPSIRRPRNYTEISDQIPITLSPKKSIQYSQYESKLKLSCQSWVLYETIKNQYKRGYKPNKVSSFNGFFRILILLCYCEIIQKIPSHKKIKFFINPNNLKQNKILSPKKKQTKSLKVILQRKKTHKTFTKGSIVYLYDLIRAMIISGNQDLFQYSLLVCGYLVTNLQNNLQNENFPITIQEEKQDYYANKLCIFVNKNFASSINEIKQSKVFNKEEDYQFYSTVNEIAKIFISCMQKYPIFKQIIQLQFITTYYKYQTGFKYWQDRKMTIRSNETQKKTDYFCKIIYKGEKNYEAICINQNLHILIIIQDSKFSMGDLDIQVIEDWYLNVTKNRGLRVRSSSIISPIKNKKATLPLIAITNN